MSHNLKFKVMRFIATLKRKFKKAIEVELIAEDINWAKIMIKHNYPGHSLIDIEYA